MLEPDYRYGYTRGLVSEIDGQVAGVLLVTQIKMNLPLMNR